MCATLCALEPHGGASIVMDGVNQSFVWGYSMTIGVLANIYPISVSWVLSKK